MSGQDNYDNELLYDGVVNRDVSTTMTTTTVVYDYNKYVNKIKHLLYNAELVAKLYIQLANKYSASTTTNERVSYIHSAQITYNVIKANNHTNFAHVITHLLSYLDVIKSEEPIPENVSIPNLLTFLKEMVTWKFMMMEHVTMISYLLTRQNYSLLPYHELRMSFLITCFKRELSQVDVDTDDRHYLRMCFIKLCEYFASLDIMLMQQMTHDYLLTHISDSNSMAFIMDVLTYMGLIQEKVVVMQNINAPLVILDLILISKRMSLSASQKLRTFIRLNKLEFEFSSAEMETVVDTLGKTINLSDEEVHINACIICGTDMGVMNPRQLCGKLFCCNNN